MQIHAFFYVVRVDCEDKEQADHVMAERLGHDEDYGFDYTLDWRKQVETEAP